LPPTNDWIFKLLFGDERNKSILIDLLKSFMDLPQEEFEMIAERNPEIRKATDALYTLSADPAVRVEYEMREKAWRDNISRVHDAVVKERGKWQEVVADKDAENERLRAQIAELQAKADAFK